MASSKASAPSKTTETYTGTRVTITSKTPYNTVLSRLRAEIQSSPESGPTATKSLFPNDDPPPMTKEKFISTIESKVGPHGFMQFYEVDHASWLPLFGVGGGRHLKRILLGNPLIAITMLKHDLKPGLNVPVELLLLENEGDSSSIVYQLPSGLIAGCNMDNEELVKAARVLDEKLEALINHVLE